MLCKHASECRNFNKGMMCTELGGWFRGKPYCGVLKYYYKEEGDVKENGEETEKRGQEETIAH